MGLPATFSVSATGGDLAYQWTRNGDSIPGATASTYETPTTAFSDSGEVFAVTVRNSAGSQQSAGASLTVTARAPMAGDLRFQQVDSASTVNGYGNLGGIATNILGNTDADYAPAIGTSFEFGSGGNCVPGFQPGFNCGWFYIEFNVAAGTRTGSLLTGYGSDRYGSLLSDLQFGSGWPFASTKAGSPATPNSVIYSLDLEQPSDAFAVAWIQSTASGTYSPSMQTVSPSGLQAAASLAGANGRVVTAISYDAGQVTFLSYAWSADTTTQYETAVVNASPADAPAAGAQLASQGFLITAIGTSDANGDVYIVGTRVQGDSMARPFLSSQMSDGRLTAINGGYAIVGTIFNLPAGSPIASGTTTWLYER
jgi:hypothetical protein